MSVDGKADADAEEVVGSSSRRKSRTTAMGTIISIYLFVRGARSYRDRTEPMYVDVAVQSQIKLTCWMNKYAMKDDENSFRSRREGEQKRIFGQRGPINTSSQLRSAVEIFAGEPKHNERNDDEGNAPAFHGEPCLPTYLPLCSRNAVDGNSVEASSPSRQIINRQNNSLRESCSSAQEKIRGVLRTRKDRASEP